MWATMVDIIVNFFDKVSGKSQGYNQKSVKSICLEYAYAPLWEQYGGWSGREHVMNSEREESFVLGHRKSNVYLYMVVCLILYKTDLILIPFFL